jgi:hypothetical protein
MFFYRDFQVGVRETVADECFGADDALFEGVGIGVLEGELYGGLSQIF